MQKNPVSILSVAVVFILTVVILLYPSVCLYYALNGLNLWFQKMIPALFPFMVLSGIMIRMNLTDAFTKLLTPVLKPLFHVNANCIYGIVIGFLCGFPMGAHVSADLYERNRINKKEAEFLLAFCNNIGPVYFISFALPTIGISSTLPALIGMYGIPLLYGLFLRYIIYKNDIYEHYIPTDKQIQPLNFLEALDESIMASLNSITKLGGYMIIFNLLNVLPHLCISQSEVKSIFGCLLEITGGLLILGKQNSQAGLFMLSLGGLSCIAQTYSMIKNTDLSLKKYIIHKLVISALCSVYYLFLTYLSFLS